MNRTRWIRLSAALAVLALAVAACGSSSSSSSKKSTSSNTTAASGKLVGTFKVTAANCAAGAPTPGSYFRMVASGGTVAAGPFVSNADSTCGDKNSSPLTPGTEGGLTTGAYQTQPNPPFDATKNGLANKITQPTTFFKVGFALSTNAKDPQTGNSVPEPSISNANGKLSGDLSALSVAWNGQQFNQGAPKPGASPPGNATGTYDSKTGAYTLEWSSPISGGPFNGFTGVWHLEGTFAKS
jgi:hypothetical protein